MSYKDIRSLPIKYRRWFIDRLVRHFKMKQKTYNDTQTTSNNKSNEDSSVDMSKVEKFFSSKFKS